MITIMMISLRSAMTEPQPHPCGCARGLVRFTAYRLCLIADIAYGIHGLNSGFWLNAIAWIEWLSSNQFPIFVGKIYWRAPA